jgi:hypothetical protein
MRMNYNTITAVPIKTFVFVAQIIPKIEAKPPAAAIDATAAPETAGISSNDSATTTAPDGNADGRDRLTPGGDGARENYFRTHS